MNLRGGRRVGPEVEARDTAAQTAASHARGGDYRADLEALLAGAGMDVGAARDRADAVAGATGDAGEAVAALAAAGVAALALSSSLPPEGYGREIARLVGRARGSSEESAAGELLVRALAETVLAGAPPLVALEAELQLLTALVPATGVSVWLSVGGAGAVCIASAGEPVDAEPSGSAVAVPVGDAILVARPRAEGERDRCAAFLALARPAVQSQIERERSSTAETTEHASVTGAGERLLVRLGLDLHDGALQELVALAADLRLFRSQLATVVGDDHVEIVLGRVDDLEARLGALERELRDLAESLQPRSLLARPFTETFRDEVESFGSRSGIAVAVTLDGAFEGLTASQRLAVLRIVQEALTNAREHGGASRVGVSLAEGDDGLRLDVIDDGSGFADGVLERAAARGRLGIAGMRERAALLGGTLSIESRPGGPTSVSAHLPRWTPPA